MPQMAPLLWFPLGFMMFLTLLAVILSLYFFNNQNLNLMEKSSLSSSSYNWKW